MPSSTYVSFTLDLLFVSARAASTFPFSVCVSHHTVHGDSSNRLSSIVQVLLVSSVLSTSASRSCVLYDSKVHTVQRGGLHKCAICCPTFSRGQEANYKSVCYGNDVADCCCASTGNSGSLEVQVQHLQFLHHPVCLSCIAGMISLAPKATQAARLSQATNALPGRHAQMLTQAQHALKQSLLPSISVQVHVALFKSCLHRKATHSVYKELEMLLS